MQFPAMDLQKKYVPFDEPSWVMNASCPECIHNRLSSLLGPIDLTQREPLLHCPTFGDTEPNASVKVARSTLIPGFPV